ncbi:hypothetical protein BBJ28_00009042 [Nothophytophthora sp. Chile5]|nr:hypothetical protein BBJ28_00009042 [Nothophytophthora sp. Chile5]
MVGPVGDGEFYCNGREFGYCDRHSGNNADAAWNCSPVAESHRVCGHRGVFSFASPLYEVAEAANNITVTVQRSGGDLGYAALLYDLQHVTSTAADVSPTMFYTSSQRLDFAPGVVALSFQLQIHDNHVVEGNRTFCLILREPFAPEDHLAVAPATLGNQRRTLVTIVDDDAARPVANLSYVVDAGATLARGGAAGDTLSFQIRSVLGSGVSGLDAVGQAVFLVTSSIQEDDQSVEPSPFQATQFGSISQSSGADPTRLNCTWRREHAGNYTVAVYLLYPGGLRGEYFGDAWLGGSFDSDSISTAAVTRIDRHVNFTWGSGPAFPGAQSHLSVRWSGWLQPLVSGSTMLAVSVVGYARLWLDDVLLLDRWGAGSEQGDKVPAGAAAYLNTSRLYSIVLEYRTPSGGDDVYVRLLWGVNSSTGSAKLVVIPAQQLFSASHIQDSPFANVTVTPATSASAAFSTSSLRNEDSLTSPALQSVAGDVFAFHVLPRDAYGNRWHSVDQHGTQRDVIAANLTLVTDCSLGGLGTRLEDGLVAWDAEIDDFRVTTRLQRSGDYAMVVQVNGNALAGSPFTVVVVPAQLSVSRCVLSGPGLLVNRVAGMAVNVTLETRDLYANRIYTGGLGSQLKLQASATTGVVPTVATAQVTDNNNGTYIFTYTPHVAGSYRVAVTWRDGHLHNSPYTITVIPNTPVGSTSSALGTGILNAQTNVQASFEVTTRDSSGNDVPHGGVAAQLAVVLQHPERGNVSGSVCLDLLNGHYTCTYTAQYVGVTRLHVTLAQSAIVGSPFLVNVTAGPALGSHCEAHGGALISAVAGERTNFTVNIFDAFGNPKANAGGESLLITFTGPGSLVTTVVNADVMVAYLGDGAFLVAYTLLVEGSYKLDVEVDGVAINASPFTVYTHPALAWAATTSLDLLVPAFPTSSVDPPLVFEAGALIVARLTVRDALGNILESGGHSFQLDDTVQSFQALPVLDERNGSYLLTLRPEHSALFDFTPKLMVPGGLNGSYYAAGAVPVGVATAVSPPKHSLLVLQRRDATIDMDFGERPPQPTQSMETFSVRWEGFVFPQFSEIYTFEVNVLGRASLRIGEDSAIVQDGATSALLKVAVMAQSFVALELNFTKPRKLPNASVRLLWTSLSQSHEVIPSSRLFTSWPIVNNVPPLDVKPSLAEPTAFTAMFGASAMSSASATTVQAVVSEPLVFLIEARDRFGNRLRGEDDATLHVLLPQLPEGDAQPDLTIRDLHNGSYEVTLVPRMSGSFSMTIAALPTAQEPLAPPGGDAFVAFLRTYHIQGSPFLLQVDPGSPSADASTLVGGGFVTATAGELTTFAVELRDDRGDRLTAAMVASALGEVQIKLQSVSTGLEVSGNVTLANLSSSIWLEEDEEQALTSRELQVEYTAIQAGLYAILLSVDDGISFAQKTTKLRVVPTIASALASTVSPRGEAATSQEDAVGSGLGPQIATNQYYTFHVTVRDVLGNIRDSGGDLLAVHVRGPEVLTGNVTDLHNGDYVIAYEVTLSGAYEIETQVAGPKHGLVGYYYADSEALQRNARSAMRVIDPVLSFDWRLDASTRGYPRVVWRGFILPRFTELYTLRVDVQEDVGSAAAVYIDGQAVVDGLSADPLTGATSGVMQLVAGRLHAIAVEYRSASNQRDPGFLSLYWQSDRQVLEIVPTEALVAEAQELLPRIRLVAVD